MKTPWILLLLSLVFRSAVAAESNRCEMALGGAWLDEAPSTSVIVRNRSRQGLTLETVLYEPAAPGDIGEERYRSSFGTRDPAFGEYVERLNSTLFTSRNFFLKFERVLQTAREHLEGLKASNDFYVESGDPTAKLDEFVEARLPAARIGVAVVTGDSDTKIKGLLRVFDATRYYDGPGSLLYQRVAGFKTQRFAKNKADFVRRFARRTETNSLAPMEKIFAALGVQLPSLEIERQKGRKVFEIGKYILLGTGLEQQGAKFFVWRWFLKNYLLDHEDGVYFAHVSLLKNAIAFRDQFGFEMVPASETKDVPEGEYVMKVEGKVLKQKLEALTGRLSEYVYWKKEKG